MVLRATETELVDSRFRREQGIQRDMCENMQTLREPARLGLFRIRFLRKYFVL